VIALDTNILIRTIVRDDPQHVDLAVDMMANNVCYVTRSVVQEVVWVLTRIYRQSASQVAAVIDLLLDIQQIEVEDEFQIMQAVIWYRQGMDFADALHLATSLKANSLATFDKGFIKAASAIQTPIPVYHP
jgi:predicted nucleic-acid-binding protein